MTTRSFRGLFLCALLGALAFRLVRLDVRPMHHDEANQAVKLGALLERGEYRFDPTEHHGPSLYYLTWPVARLAAGTSLDRLDERTLRIVPALFGAGLLLLFPLLVPGLSRRAAVAAAALAAFSPALTYYGRFYIQETLLVFFLAALVAAGWRYALRPSAGWAAAAGFSAGMMFATKETSVLLLASMTAALGVVKLLAERDGVRSPTSWGWDMGRPRAARSPWAWHAILFVFSGAAVAALLYSSLLSHPQGIVDSVRAVLASAGRAAHPGVHAHPWTFYLQTLACSRASGGGVWSEGFVLALALIGGLAAFAAAREGEDTRLLRFVALFTLVAGIAFSLIPYKTPWNMLSFYWGAIVLASHGIDVLLRAIRSHAFLVAMALVLAAGLLHLGWQAYRTSFVAHSDPSNPYAYAQTSPDLLRLVGRVEAEAAASPEGKAILIKVIAPADEIWPLPWYFRSFGRVGYWTAPQEALDFAAAGEASVVIASASFAEEVASALGDRYDRSFYGLRYEVPLALFIRRAP